MSDRYADLERIQRLKETGVLSEDEFQLEKARLLNAPASIERPAEVGPRRGDGAFWGMERNTFAMLLHLSQVAGYVVPLAGWILPIVMWVSVKDQDPGIDRHGRIVINWIISSLIYAVVFAILCLVLIGIPLLIALCICGVVFAIIGAVRANEGVAWRYPGSIGFFPLPPEDPAV